MRLEAEAISVAAVVAVVAALLAVPPSAAAGQQRDVRFSSFDVGIGLVAPDDASLGLTYGVGFDVADLPLQGLSTRFGFRFWSSDDEPAGVDLDDGMLELLVKAHVDAGAARAYGGIGFGAHFIAARFADAPGVEEARDGFRPGLQALAGVETSIGADRFLEAFVEAVGSWLADVPHAVVQAGVRVRFDGRGRAR